MFVLEMVILALIVWLIMFLSTLFHELGHVMFYMIFAGDMQWHIQMGCGKQLFETKRLSVGIIPYSGLCSWDGTKIRSKSKAVAAILGGPVFSLVLFLILFWCSKHVGIASFLADSASRWLIRFPMMINGVWLFLGALIPMYYHVGPCAGMPSDGLRIFYYIQDSVEDEEMTK